MDGTILYRWSNSDTGEEIQGFSTDPDIGVSPAATTSYMLDVACSQEQSCGDSVSITVPVYDGVNAGMRLAISGRSPTTLEWFTPPLPAVFDLGTHGLVRHAGRAHGPDEK